MAWCGTVTGRRELPRAFRTGLPHATGAVRRPVSGRAAPVGPPSPHGPLPASYGLLRGRRGPAGRRARVAGSRAARQMRWGALRRLRRAAAPHRHAPTRRRREDTGGTRTRRRTPDAAPSAILPTRSGHDMPECRATHGLPSATGCDDIGGPPPYGCRAPGVSRRPAGPPGQDVGVSPWRFVDVASQRPHCRASRAREPWGGPPPPTGAGQMWGCRSPRTESSLSFSWLSVPGVAV